eukprot:gene8531-biopygen8655
MVGNSKGKGSELFPPVKEAILDTTKDFPPLPGKAAGAQPPSPSPTQAVQPTQESLLQQILEIQKQQAEDHRVLREQLHRQVQINAELEAKITTKAGSKDSDSATKTAEQLLEKRKKLDHVPEASVNPFPARPATLTTRMPQLYDLHGNKTYDALNKKSNSSMRYECLVLGPALSYLHDVVAECNETLDESEDGNLSAGGANENANRHSGMRVLPYMDDFLVQVDSQREGFLRREKVQRVLHRLGLQRNEKKGQWDPVQVVEHLGLEVDLKLGQFRVTERRVQKIHAKAKEILCDAARNRRWIPARRLAAFTGLCQSVYLAVPAARLYLRELYFVLAEKRSWGAKVTVGTKIEVFWEDDDCFYPGVVKKFNEDGKGYVLYDDGDEETLDLSKENFKIIGSTPVSEPTDKAADTTEENIDCGGNYEINKRGGAVENFLTLSLCERWRKELGQSRLTELAVKMQRKSLLDTTMSNYGPKARRFIHFCVQQRRPWLPATEATVVLYVAAVLEDGGVRVASMQPYLSAVNNYHEDLGFPGPAKGRAVTRAVKGMAAIQAEAAVEDENIETQRTWLPAGHVRRVHEAALKVTPRSSGDLQLLRAFSYVVIAFVTFGRPDTGTSLSRQHVQCTDTDFSGVLLKEKGRRHLRTKRRLCIPWRGVDWLQELVLHWQRHRDAAWSRTSRTQPDSYCLLPEDPKIFKASVANDWISRALCELNLRPPEGGHFSAHSTRKGATTCARAVGVAMEKVCFFGGWSQFSSAVQHYIDPTALRDTDMNFYFEWLTWSQ